MSDDRRALCAGEPASAAGRWGAPKVGPAGTFFASQRSSLLRYSIVILVLELVDVQRDS